MTLRDRDGCTWSPYSTFCSATSRPHRELRFGTRLGDELQTTL